MVVTYYHSSDPLSTLSKESRNLLSSLLNIKTVVPTVAPDQLSRHRDWRGLASLANISNELAASINECDDKTAKVLEIWIQKNDGTATIGRMLQYLQWIDRFDVYDDILELARLDKLIVKPGIQSNQAISPQVTIEDTDENIITFDDKYYNKPQRYHAYVLYAEEDKDFVDELLSRMKDQQFLICTEDKLIPGHGTKFERVARLIAERCRHIILVYSPDFLESPAINFYMNLAQADGITKKQHKIIPIMYRDCILPDHLKFYHNLRYNPGEKAPYDFWQKLSRTLDSADLPRLKSTSSTHSDIKIAEMTNPMCNGYTPVKYQHSSHSVPNVLALPSIPTSVSSLNDLRDLSLTADTISLESTMSERKKKTNPIRKILDTFRGKKHKNAVKVQN